ncbi:oxidoreductase family protein [Lentzea sp. NPDC051213]|uniref:oxidoreductase family protein n=1 Tax=Lentzea sp. NPDC051213 TaxID=3364126 RepID=UPI00379AEAF7
MRDFPVLIDEVTPAWLSRALGRTVKSFTAQPVGTGQIGTCYRLALHGIGTPNRVIIKLPAADPATRALLAGTYRVEVCFYRDIANTVNVRAPACYHHDSADDGDFVLLLEDLAPSRQGDQLIGCSIAQAHDAVVNLAGLHGPRWCDPTLLRVEGLGLNGLADAAALAEFYGPANEVFLDRVGGLLAPADRDTLREIPGVLEKWALGRAERFALVHGDYRVDNLLFSPNDGAAVHAVDWQTLSLALPARDLAYFVATSLEPAARRNNEQDLVGTYHRALGPDVTAGFTYEQCWDDYRFAMLQGPLISVFGLAYGKRTDRGDRMFAVMATRACAAIRDLDSIACV